MLLVISPKYGTRPDAVKLIEAARTKHIDTTTLLNSWEHTKNNLSGNQRVAPYGEHAFCEFIAQEMGLNLFQNCLDWTSRLPHHFLKRDVRYMTLGDAMELEEKQGSILSKRILEPGDDPCFQMGIWTDGFPRVPKDTPVMVHSDNEWLVKYRFIVIDGQIASYCCYKVFQLFNQPSIWQNQFVERGTTAEGFTRTLLNHFNSAPACIIDVGFVKDAGWSVWNTYPIWSAELYGCDPHVMLKGIFTACQQVTEN